MERDLSVVVVVAVLGLVAFVAGGWLPALHLGPSAYLSLVLLITSFACLGAVPWLEPGGERPWRVGAVALAGAPFLVFGLLEAPRSAGAWLLPAPAWGLAVGAGVVLSAFPARPARRVATVLLVLLALDGALAPAGRALLPRTWAGVSAPVLVVEQPVRERTPKPVRGLWVGAPTRVGETPLGRGPGPWFVPATDGRFADRPPRVVLFDGSPAADVTRRGGALFVPAPALPDTVSLPLSGFDAAVVLSGAWPEDAPDAGARAEALALFTRRGGLLLGPAPGRSWPEGLARRLGPAAKAVVPGPEGRRLFGLGAVVRVDSPRQIDAVLERRGVDPAPGTVFDRDPERWRRLESRLLPAPAAPDRRPEGALLLGYAAAIALLDRLLRRGPLRLLGLLMPTLAVLLGLLWISPGAPSPRVGAVGLDLGGGGGRRVEAVLLRADRYGWRGRVAWRGGGIVRRVGGVMDSQGRLVLEPGQRAWVVRDTLGRGGFAGERESPLGAVAGAFLRGDVAPARLRFGRVSSLAIDVEGVPAVGAFTAVWSPSGP